MLLNKEILIGIYGSKNILFCTGNLLTNGQFTNSNVSTVGGTAAGWNLNNVDVHDISVYGYNNQPRNPFLDLVSLNFGPGIASQTVSSFNVGDSYNLNFYLGSDKSSSGSTTNDRTVRVGIWNGGSNIQLSSYELTAQNVAVTYESFNWQLYTLQFIATNSTLTVSFSGYTNNFAYGPTLDNVCLLKTLNF